MTFVPFAQKPLAKALKGFGVAGVSASVAPGKVQADVEPVDEVPDEVLLVALDDFVSLF